MIRFENVSFGYSEKRPILNDLSFHIEKGDFVALIGANGAGKSTISRLVNGLLHPTKGHVYLNGKDTLKTPSSTLARDCGFLFQNPDRQICENTVKDEIAFSMKAQGWPSDLIADRTRAVLETFDLDPEWFPFSRSRGERQRIALASVLACEPGLLILDEPTTGLDYLECIRIMDHVTGLNQEKGVTVLMVSHDMELVQSYAKNVLVLNHGQILGQGPTNEMMKNVEVLKKARVLPAQIPELALRFGDEFKDVFTVEDMLAALRGRAGKGGAL
ncbi:MAG: ABC transporter ATP-binding protein [Butyrivibrio sp.]|uniref:energy-coupling factor ABC transporter ATP-binding protein n=1 Tax=Butyrivibrio sp. TaxID=28121 RepID=UPI001B6866E6|nr:ABC transporter ATP-binding protein [Butyrivibrio sp.]MBP3784864.1 ABC transporter ATP-binding protein [Butyrivibrio sp.]MBP3815066.1 ABC transporter ATP-binding protein [Butyrivibrio sp.]